MTDSALSGLRVALVHDWLTGLRGGEKVLEQLCLLFPEAPIFTLFHFEGTVGDVIGSHRIRTSVLQHAPRIRSHYRHYLPLYPWALSGLDLQSSNRKPFDLVVSTSHCVAKSVKTSKSTVHVCYCHTPMRYAWDQKQIYFPSRGPVSWPRNAILAALRRWDTATSKRVDTFVANSSFVQDRIRRYYQRQAEVIPPPVDVDFFSLGSESESTSQTPFVLMVAALSPYKRLDLAIAACERLGLELRIVGTGPEYERLATAGGRVRLLGSVAREELRSLYRSALCFLQPGVEDFGIATVEAIACGCPVVALDHGGVRDIITHPKHGVLYEGPKSLENLVSAVDKTQKMQFNRLDLRRRAERFSTAEFKNRMQELLQRVVSEKIL